ncbi:MAG: Uma2 family endonuclease [Chloroflexaceae bacterium]|nr:Uma2 family endonuclease [Chloroflexaceae bacterium]
MTHEIADRIDRREQPIAMSYAAYLALPELTRAEWVDGETIIFMPPNIVHQTLTTFLTTFIYLYVDFFKLGKVLAAPVEMRLVKGHISREPDILFVQHEHLHRFDGLRLEGPADLVVEVVSPESVQRDQERKYSEYAQYGVSEYWLVDPRPGKQTLTVYQRNAAGQYEGTAPDGQGVFIRRCWGGSGWMEGGCGRSRCRVCYSAGRRCRRR